MRIDLEAQDYRSLSLPKEGKEPFLDYPNKHGGGQLGHLLVVRDHAVIACLFLIVYRLVVLEANGLLGGTKARSLEGRSLLNPHRRPQTFSSRSETR